MKRGGCILIILLLACSFIAAQDQQSKSEGESESIVNAYMRNFARASLQTKVQILQDAQEVEDADMGPLYLKAVTFVVDNQELLKSDSMMRQLAVLAVQLIGIAEYTAAKDRLWDLFSVDTNTQVRVAIMNTFGEIATGETRIIGNLNQWLSRQNTLYQTEKKPDIQVIGECVSTLGKIGDPSSFRILFTTMTLGYSEAVTKKAREALSSIGGNLKEHLIGVIEKNAVRDKLAALHMALDSDTLSDEEKGQVAEKALEVALLRSPSSAPSDSASREALDLRKMRYLAIRALTERTWSKATPLVIEHFNNIVVEYERGVVNKSNLLEAIACLGAMGTHEAAARLNMYLGLLNQYKENEKQVDEQIALATIKNLGQLGDSVAADNLLYAQYLGYSARVRKAAKEAFNNLKRGS